MVYGIIHIVLVPILIWSRWNGSAMLFNALLAAYIVLGIMFLVKEGN